MTGRDTGGRGEGRSSDLVMVEREVLADALAFLESEMHWSQPAPDMGEEPSDQFTYDAIPVAMALRAALQSVEGGVQGSIATKQATDETAASVLSDPPEEWVICAGCYGEGSINKTIHVYEAGCGFSHPDVEAIICPECNGSGGIISEIGPVCEICGGDCASANPPMIFCPMRDLSSEDRS